MRMHRRPSGESIWTIEVPPDTLTLPFSLRPLKVKDAPFVRPSARKRSAGLSLRTLGEYEAWEAMHVEHPVDVLSTDPTIRRYDHFFSIAECKTIQE